MCQIFVVFIATCWRQFPVRRLKGFPLLIQLALLPERYIWYDVRMNNRIIENPNAIETSKFIKVRPAKVRRCPTHWWGSIARLVGGGLPKPAYFCQNIVRVLPEHFQNVSVNIARPKPGRYLYVQARLSTWHKGARFSPAVVGEGSDVIVTDSTLTINPFIRLSQLIMPNMILLASSFLRRCQCKAAAAALCFLRCIGGWLQSVLWNILMVTVWPKTVFWG